MPIRSRIWGYVFSGLIFLNLNNLVGHALAKSGLRLRSEAFTLTGAATVREQRSC